MSSEPKLSAPPALQLHARTVARATRIETLSVIYILIVLEILNNKEYHYISSFLKKTA